MKHIFARASQTRNDRLICRKAFVIFCADQTRITICAITVLFNETSVRLTWVNYIMNIL